jgi:hypothetical protein
MDYRQHRNDCYIHISVHATQNVECRCAAKPSGDMPRDMTTSQHTVANTSQFTRAIKHGLESHSETLPYILIRVCGIFRNIVTHMTTVRQRFGKHWKDNRC